MQNPKTSSSSFKNTATSQNYTLSLHDALPILQLQIFPRRRFPGMINVHHIAAHPGKQVTFVVIKINRPANAITNITRIRSEEHMSELQSRLHIVCRPLLEKKKRSSRTR